jgi:DNA-binding transcriptional regulator YdaS (Cro superfamily)
MQLRDYLTSRNLSFTAFAAQVGVVHTTVMRWCDGVSEPRPEHIKRIEEATGGLVTAAEVAPRWAAVFTPTIVCMAD